MQDRATGKWRLLLRRERSIGQGGHFAIEGSRYGLQIYDVVAEALNVAHEVWGELRQVLHVLAQGLPSGLELPCAVRNLADRNSRCLGASFGLSISSSRCDFALNVSGLSRPRQTPPTENRRTST